MKKFLFNILMIMTLVGGLASCGGDDIKDGGDYSFLFAENPVMVGPAGGNASVMVIADVAFTPVVLDSWITDVTAESAELVSFKVGANTSSSARDGKIAFYIDGTEDVKELTVRQGAAQSGLTVGKSSLSFEAKGAEEEIAVNAKSNWEIESAPDWLTATKKNAYTLVVTADVNYQGKALAGEIVLKTATESASITVSQKNDNSFFHGASTAMGRRFAYNSGLVTRVVTDKSYTVTDGVEALEIKYMSSHTGSELPYYAYIFVVDLTKNVTILASCVGDDPASIKKTDKEVTKAAIIREQFASMKSKRPDITVWGGINGDFCYGTGSQSDRNSLLHGVMHKDGVCLKETFDGGSACTVFAMMKDGSARIIKQNQYNTYKADIQEAIGGRQIIMDSGAITTVKNGTMDPRTAIGVSADRKKVIMLAIDGRQAQHSNGADYPDMGKMFKAMGAYNAINLDGGGSTTFVVADASDAKGFKTKNSPSNSYGEREVPNGLAIVSK